MKKLLALLSLVFLLSGCAGMAHQNQLREFYKSMDEGITQRKTYDDCLSRFGPPSRVTDGDAIMIATWEGETGTVGGGFFRVGNAVGYLPPKSHGYNMKLTFDKKSRAMVEWRYNEW